MQKLFYICMTVLMGSSFVCKAAQDASEAVKSETVDELNLRAVTILKCVINRLAEINLMENSPSKHFYIKNLNCELRRAVRNKPLTDLCECYFMAPNKGEMGIALEYQRQDFVTFKTQYPKEYEAACMEGGTDRLVDLLKDLQKVADKVDVIFE